MELSEEEQEAIELFNKRYNFFNRSKYGNRSRRICKNNKRRNI